MKNRSPIRFKIFVFIVLLFVCLQSLSASSSENLNFNVHWYVDNTKVTTISILPYSGQGTLPQDEHDVYLKEIVPLNNSSLYNVCLVKYETNEKGTHKIQFSATPFVKEQNNSEQYAYSLYITYNNGFPVILDVDPNEQDNSKLLTFSVIGVGKITANIYLDAVLTDFNEMLVGDYSSTVTITRYSE